VRVVVNLVPTDLRKEGTAFDLPIALALLAASRQLPMETLADLWCAGELGLNGKRPPGAWSPRHGHHSPDGIALPAFWCRMATRRKPV